MLTSTEIKTNCEKFSDQCIKRKMLLKITFNIINFIIIIGIPIGSTLSTLYEASIGFPIFSYINSFLAIITNLILNIPKNIEKNSENAKKFKTLRNYISSNLIKYKDPKFIRHINNEYEKIEHKECFFKRKNKKKDNYIVTTENDEEIYQINRFFI